MFWPYQSGLARIEPDGQNALISGTTQTWNTYQIVSFS